MLGGLVSFLASLASGMVLAALFGAGSEMDAYLTAQVIPVYIQAVLLTGLPFVFVPAFVEASEAGSEEDAWAMAGTFFWLLGGGLLVVSLAVSLLAPSIIALSAPGLSPAKAELSARMLSVLAFAVPFTGLGSLTSGIQNARDRFFFPSLGGALGAVGNLLTLLLLYRLVGPMALAWAFVVSQVLRASVTVVPVLRHGWGRLMSLRDSRLPELAKLMAPFILFGIVLRSTSLVERFFASSLPDGDLSYIGYATKVSQMVRTVLGTAVITAVFPALAKAYTREGKAGLVETTEYGLRLAMAVGLPLLAILSAVAVPLISVLFERGAFDEMTTVSVSRIIPIVFLGIFVFDMVGSTVSRTYYVLKDTRTVPIVGAAATLIYILMAGLLVDAGGYVGLVSAKPIYMGFTILILFLLLLRRVPFFHIGKLLRSALIFGLASLVAFLVAWLVSNLATFLPDLVRVMLASALAGVLYLALLWLLDREMAMSLLEMVGVPRIVAVAKNGFQRAVGSAPR
jgi:putative peptidoglycan lipid II flippase